MKEHLATKAWHSDDQCLYCHEKLEHPTSQHEGIHHYKQTKCKKCGKKIWFKVNFHGSGHDNFSYSDLEKKVV